MKYLTLCFGFLSCLYLGECTITAWTVPLLAVGTGNTDGTGNAGTVYFNEGDTTIQTVAATFGGGRAVASYEIESQTPAGFFTMAAGTGGVITIASSGVLDADATTTSHVLTIKTVDDTAGTALSATVTVTYSILGGQFLTGYSCLYLESPTAASDAIVTNGMQSGGTNAITIDSGNTDTDFAIVAGTGAITAANDITAASGTSGSYTLVLKGVENIGTASTVTATVNICVLGSSCTCAMTSSSAAAHITAGLLGIFAALIMTLLK